MKTTNHNKTHTNATTPLHNFTNNNDPLKSASLYDLIQLSLCSQTQKCPTNGIDLTSFIRDAMKHAQPKPTKVIKKKASTTSVLGDQQHLSMEKDNSQLLSVQQPIDTASEHIHTQPIPKDVEHHQLYNGTHTPLRNSSLSDISYKDSASCLQDNKQSGEVNETTPKQSKTTKFICKHKKGNSISVITPKKEQKPVQEQRKQRLQAFITPIRMQDQYNGMYSARYSSLQKASMVQESQKGLTTIQPKAEKERSVSNKGKILSRVSSMKDTIMQKFNQSPKHTQCIKLIQSPLKKQNAHTAKKTIEKPQMKLMNKANITQELKNALLSQFNKDAQREKHEALVKKLQKAPSRKKQMNNAINNLSAFILDEFSRIKKPQKQALLIGQMFCVLICTFKQPQLDSLYSVEMVMLEFEKWESIQNFILNSLNRILQEVTLIKTRALKKDQFNLDFAKALIKHIGDNEAYLRNITNRNFKDIFNLIHKTLQYLDYKHFRPKQPKKMTSHTDIDTLQSPLFTPLNHDVYSNFEDYQYEKNHFIDTDDYSIPTSVQQELMSDSETTFKVLNLDSQKPHLIQSVVLSERNDISSSRKPKHINSVIQEAQQSCDKMSEYSQPEILRCTLTSNTSLQELSTPASIQSNYKVMKTPSNAHKKSTQSKSPIVFKKRNDNKQMMSPTRNHVAFKNTDSQVLSQQSMKKSASQIIKKPQQTVRPVQQNPVQHQRNLTEESQYQIQNYNKDIFSIKVTEEDKGSTNNEEQELFQSSIRVYQTTESQDDLFSIKLIKIQDYYQQQQELEEAHARVGLKLVTQKPENERQIDMNTIEELKKRRAQSRDRGATLDAQRDEIIRRIQEEMLGPMSAKADNQ